MKRRRKPLLSLVLFSLRSDRSSKISTFLIFIFAFLHFFFLNPLKIDGFSSALFPPEKFNFSFIFLTHTPRERDRERGLSLSSRCHAFCSIFLLSQFDDFDGERGTTSIIWAKVVTWELSPNYLVFHSIDPLNYGMEKNISNSFFFLIYILLHLIPR